MRKMSFLLAAILLSSTVGLSSAKAQDFGQYQKMSFIRNGRTLPYRILYPKGYQKDKKYPLLVFLHGSGERGNDNAAQLLHGGFVFLQDSIRKNYPAIVIFPQCPADSSWSFIEFKFDPALRKNILVGPFQQEPTEPARWVKELTDSLVGTGVVDEKRIYIEGLSMGGFGVFDMLERYPDYFAAAIPICGGGDTTMANRFAGKTPVRIFHGGADPIVAVESSRRYYHALKRLGADVDYTEYPGVGHNSWDNVFVERDLLHWLFSNKKE
jgi:predicted peptidase